MALAFLGFGIVASILTISFAGLYALPNGDDFCRASLQPLISSVKGWGASDSSFAYVLDSWRFWTGRWTSMWIKAAVLSTIDITRVYPVALFGAWAAILACFWTVVRQVLPRDSALAGTLILFALYWANVPEPGEALFWFTGLIENILPVATSGVVIALLASGRARWVALILSVVIPGLHELFGALFCVVLVVGGALAWVKDPKTATWWCACFGVAIVSEAMAFTAPGNAVRAAYYAAPSAAPALKLTAWQLINYLPNWSLSGSMLAATGLVMLYRPDAPWVDEAFPGWLLALIPCLTLGLVVVAIAASTYLLTAPLAPRTIAGLFLAFLFGWLMTVVGLAQRLPKADRSLSSVFALALGAALVLQGNVRAGLFDLKDKVGPWHAAMEARYADLRANKGRVLVPPPPPTPSVFFWRDILDDPADFRNVCLAHYFHVNSVAVSRSPE